MLEMEQAAKLYSTILSLVDVFASAPCLVPLLGRLPNQTKSLDEMLQARRRQHKTLLTSLAKVDKVAAAAAAAAAGGGGSSSAAAKKPAPAGDPDVAIAIAKQIVALADKSKAGLAAFAAAKAAAEARAAVGEARAAAGVAKAETAAEAVIAEIEKERAGAATAAETAAGNEIAKGSLIVARH